MKFIYIKRTISWISTITYTLFKFWIENPKETLAILSFITEKIIASPRFFSRNILIEKHSHEFQKVLIQTTKLYNKYGKEFNPQDPNSYKKLEEMLSEKSQILYFLIRTIKPEIVLETGVAGGKSTGYILQAIYDNTQGKLYSIDLPFQWYIYGDHKLHLDSLPAGKMPGYLIPKKLTNNWFLFLGDTKEELPKLLKSLQKIDVFFHDSEHSDRMMTFEYNQSWPYIKIEGYLLSDDITYTNAFKKFAKVKNLQPIRFLDIGIIKKTG